MTQYIDKFAVVAEIEKRIEEYKNMKIDSSYYEGMVASLEFFRDEFIDSLEVKEVDLDDDKKEELAQKYADYIYKRYNIDADSIGGKLIYHAYMHGMNQCLTQLRAQKGEEL